MVFFLTPLNSLNLIPYWALVEDVEVPVAVESGKKSVRK